MVRSQGLPAGVPETDPGAAREGSESQRSGESPSRQGVSAGSPVPGEPAGEGVSASATSGYPGQQTSTATSVTSHSSTRVVEPAAFNRLCPQPPRDPPGTGTKRKRLARGGDVQGEGEEKSLFYMRVRAVNGVSVTWETRTGFRAVGKRPRLFKASYTGGESFAGSGLSSSRAKSELGGVDLKAEGSAGGPGEEKVGQAIAGQKMGATPAQLLPTAQGLRCLACCRVFPSLEALIHHVKHGLREGFSCRVYYRALGQFMARATSPRRSRRRGEHRHQSRRRPCSRCGGVMRRPRRAAR